MMPLNSTTTCCHVFSYSREFHRWQLVYYKPTDTKQYLDFYSCHPRHVKHNVPFNLARRICTIVPDPSLREARLEDLKHTLIARKYPENLVTTGITKAKSIPLTTLRTPTQKNNQDVIAYVSTYDPNQDNIFQKIYDNIPFLKSSTRMDNALSNVKIINSKRQAPSLKKLLTKAKFDGQNIHSKMVTKCCNARCKLCLNLVESSEVYFFNAETHFQIKYDMNCNSKYVIYVLFCAQCNEYYIGETDDLRKRTNLHRSHIENMSTTSLSVSQHIAKCASKLKIKFRIIPFYKVRTQTKISLLNMESYFIAKFKPSLNR